jgi:hypothetical protein
MNPDVVAAVDDLVRRGVLAPRDAVALRRAASGSLVSVHDGFRALLWAGALLVTSGAGLLVKQNLDRIGPVALAAALGGVALACLTWAWRRGPSASFAFDTVLLVGALLAAADLAFIEAKFTPLGAEWPLHLLLVAAAYALLAYRFDSRSLFSLALTSFAAWRGVSVAGLASPWGGAGDGDRLLVEALGCGALFLALGKTLERFRVKPQFEPVASWLGWIVIFGALALRLGDRDGRLVVATTLAACGIVLAWFSWDERRVGRYALGLAAASVGAGGWAAQAAVDAGAGPEPFLVVVALLAGAVIALVLRAHRLLRAPS